MCSERTRIFNIPHFAVVSLKGTRSIFYVVVSQNITKEDDNILTRIQLSSSAWEYGSRETLSKSDTEIADFILTFQVITANLK